MIIIALFAGVSSSEDFNEYQKVDNLVQNSDIYGNDKISKTPSKLTGKFSCQIVIIVVDF